MVNERRTGLRDHVVAPKTAGGLNVCRLKMNGNKPEFFAPGPLTQDDGARLDGDSQQTIRSENGMRNTITLIMGLLLSMGQISLSQAASQQVIGTTLESFSDPVNCRSTTYCVLSFLPLPAGKTYFIERVRCRVSAATIPAFMSFGPSAQAGIGNLIKKTYFEQISSTYESPSYYLTYEAIPSMMIGSGRYPTVTS